jgi:hypothetical protein
MEERLREVEQAEYAHRPATIPAEDHVPAIGRFGDDFVAGLVDDQLDQVPENDPVAVVADEP